MSKPEDIPQDVWDAGEMLAMQFVEWLTPTPSDPDTEYVFTQSIARAIMAAKAEEREACAQVCESLIEVIRDEIAGEGRPVNRGNLSGQVNAVRTAVEAIRKRGEG